EAPAANVAAGNATIAGRILDATTDEPVRKARVRAVPIDAATGTKARAIITDAQGRYVLDGLAAGRYAISASKLTFITSAHGQAEPFADPLPVATRDGQTINGIDVRLAHAGVVTGRVTDELGEPVSQVPVVVLRRRFIEDGRPQWTQVATRRTNDLGEFRLFS